MGIGYLIVEAKGYDDALPVVGARVKVKSTEDMLLYELETDQSGIAPQVSLDTIDREKSLDPNYPGKPYTSYNLEVEAEGFEILIIDGVHIFDEETSIQPVAMIPMRVSQTVPSKFKIVLGGHAVEMTGGRTQPGPIIDPHLLRHVIIPDIVTVHLGPPASNAQNVWVSFTNYIKNVASHEIYPTWPEAALRANIYVIITFILNRVFTVWYRSRGYSFDITNSTAYDQYYVYGGTIYASVSRIVDEIFNQYVRRYGQYAPFFTSFCNGTTATCPGLSQWGTVSLANSGMTPIQILRYYYPNDIQIVESNIFTSIIESYPGSPLSLGSTGLNVQHIQSRLNRIRRNYPAIPVIANENGVFGADTLAAVKAFQGIFNIYADGVVGRDTWYKISYIYVAVAKLGELESEGTGLGIGTVPPNIVLRQGMSGIDVITLQYILSFISEYYAVIPAPTQNGIFGTETAQAVLAFQRMSGLPQDGVVGPTTWNALYDTYWGIRNNTTKPPVTPPSNVIQYTVQAGDTLYLLARKFGTTVEEIKSLNGLTSDALMIGQVLLIPSSSETQNFSYTVRAGDTLYLLAQRFGTTVDAIKRLNGLTSDALTLGQVLKIPGAVLTYTVQAGDTLYLLAQRFGTTVNALMQFNGLTSNALSIGQTLFIPR